MNALHAPHPIDFPRLRKSKKSACADAAIGNHACMTEMTWLPRHTRNRLAMVIGLVSLGLFLTWNFLPFPKSGFHDTVPSNMASVTWPAMPMHVRIATHNFSNFTIEALMNTMVLILLPLLALLNLTLLPAWRLWQSSRLLRLIPALLMLSGFIVLIYYRINNSREESPGDIPLSILLPLIAGNFLATAISLLLFKNESSPTHKPIGSPTL
jgi:hypothetical protein